MADSQWDAEDFVPKEFTTTRVADKWEGEDEDDDVKDNWDDEEEEAAAAAAAAAADQEPKKELESESKLVQVKKKNIIKNKLKAKQEKLEERAAEEKAAEVAPKTDEELFEEKIRRQKLQEESDLELAKEAFGIGTNDIKTNIDSMEPSSREDFETFKKALVEKLTRYERTVHYLPFLEDLLRDLCINLESDDIKKLGSTLNALSSEKAKAAKATKTKKKTSTKKASLVVGKASDYDFVEDYGGGDEFEDFM